MLLFFVLCTGDHRDLHVRTHSFPPRRSSDLTAGRTIPIAHGQYGEYGYVLGTLRVSSKGNAHRSQHPPQTELLSATGMKLTKHRSEEHTSELQSLMRISYAVFCLEKKVHNHNKHITDLLISNYSNQTS